MRSRQALSHIAALSAVVALSAGLSLVAVGCGEDEAAPGAASVEVTQTDDGGEEAYGDEDDKAVVIVGDDTYVVVGDPGEECVELDNGDCIDISDAKDRYCNDEGAQADVVVVDGEVVDVICYPDPDGGTPQEEVVRDGDGNAEVPQNESGTVVTFNEDTDGEPIEGDLTMTAERTSIYGNGVDDTIIDGDVNISSNNSRVRGLTITGNLTLDKVSNNAAAAFCKVYGNLLVEGNNGRVVNCQIFGDVTIEGNNAVLINLGVQGGWEVNDSTACDGCYSFDDDDDDYEVLEEELGDDLTCPQTLSDVEEDNNEEENNGG